MLALLTVSLFCIQADIQVLRAVVEDRVEGYRATAGTPLALFAHNQHQYLLDAGVHLWVLSADQGRATPSNTLDEFATFRGIYSLSGQIVTVDLNGFRRNVYDPNGRLLNQVTLAQPALYADAYNELSAVAPGGLTELSRLNLSWTHKGETRQIEWVPASAKDRVSANACTLIKWADQVLALTHTSDFGILYYVLVHLETGADETSGQLALLGQARSSEPASDNVPSLLAGITTDATYGFVLTENSQTEGLCHLRCLDPKTKAWTTFQVQLPNGVPLSFFQHLEGSSWLAFDGTRLVKVSLEKS